MKRFDSISPAQLRTYKVVAFDLDDTLTEESRLRSDVVAAIERVQASGWRTLLVTGRPAGWADALIKLMPFDGIVAENGAVLQFWARGQHPRVPGEAPTRLFWTDGGRFASTPPTANRARIDKAAVELVKRHPGTRVAADQFSRLYDLAIDFAEEVSPALSLDAADRIRADFESMGAVAKVSTIHVNGWWGAFSKADGLRELLKQTGWGRAEDHLVYVGDSPNDDPLFAVAALSVGVANVADFVGRAGFKGPACVTRERSGRGALEVLTALPPL